MIFSFGTNISLSIYLLVTGFKLSFILPLRIIQDTTIRKMLLQSLGLIELLLLDCISSNACYCTGVAGILGCLIYFRD